MARMLMLVAFALVLNEMVDAIEKRLAWQPKAGGTERL